ncbi:MAG: hypothetical protein Q9170_002352 [Blastenia crenularia]
MPLTIIRFPQNQVQFLQVVHAVQVTPTTSATIRIQKKGVRVLRIAQGIKAARRSSVASSSMVSLSPSAVATGQEASFPNATYLRKRYKKLQRCTVSSNPGVGPIRQASSHDSLDPSFEAMQAMNGRPGTRPEPVIINAFVESTRSIPADTIDSLPPAPIDLMLSAPQILASLEDNPQSFSARVDRVLQAVGRGQRLRFASPDENGRVSVFARDPDAAETSSGDDAVAGASKPNNDSPIISAEQKRSLEARIRNQIAISANMELRDPNGIVIRHGRRDPVDPRVVHTEGKHGVRRHNISPIPLDYHRPRNSATPDVESNDTVSDASSPIAGAVPRQLSRARVSVYSIRSSRSANATDGVNPWFLEVEPSADDSSSVEGGQSYKGRAGQLKRHENDVGIASWVRRVKAALNPSKKPSARTPTKPTGVYRDKPTSNPNRWVGTPIPRPENVLQDLTNVRQPSYLERNSFAQDLNKRVKPGTQATARGERRPQPGKLPKPLMTRPYEQGGLTGPPNVRPSTSRRSSQASAVKSTLRKGELHPENAFALARLEGRVPPPPASPILRRTHYDGMYGPDVEIELERLRLDCPQPSRPPTRGEWTDRFQETIEEGFDSALEAPLSAEAKAYIDALQ